MPVCACACVSVEIENPKKAEEKMKCAFGWRVSVRMHAKFWPHQHP